MKTIAERWAEIEEVVLPANAPNIQRQEMRRAFYAGFQACLAAGSEMVDESGDDHERGAAIYDALHKECHQFALDIIKGLV